tara:strand:- start:7677 stop:8012 length:336 start_codon:yes stop_codon:yes gene_type:complete
MAKSTTSVSKRGQALPKGTLKVSREVATMLAELAEVRKRQNEEKRIADFLRKKIVSAVGEENLTLIHNNRVVGSVSVDVSLSVRKERLLLERPDVFNELAEESKRVTLDTK